MKKKRQKKNSRFQTLCKSCKAITTEAAQNCAHGSSSGVWSIEANGHARHVFSRIPAWFWSARVHRTWGTQAEGAILFIRFFSFKTCASFPSLLIFCFENLFKLIKFSDSQSDPKEPFHQWQWKYWNNIITKAT